MSGFFFSLVDGSMKHSGLGESNANCRQDKGGNNFQCQT